MVDDDTLRDQAQRIWRAAVAAARPEDLMAAALAEPFLARLLRDADRILVVGAGKAGAGMATGLEAALQDHLKRVEGIVNVPAKTVRPLQRIRLHIARPAGVNHPTAEGVAGTHAILDLLRQAGPRDLAICLLSGGGSALLPAPAAGLALADKQQVTQLLHACGATINEMNCVRKHLSASKGGRLAQAFAGQTLFSLIISDVVGDPLDVIASGPTAADPTTFADAMAVLERFQLIDQAPSGVLRHLREGMAGTIAETLKVAPGHVHNRIIGNNAAALAAAADEASRLGYQVLNLGGFIEGETHQVAMVLAGIVRSIRADQQPLAAPVCILSGGETTVTLTADHGLGGRNQEFVLAAVSKLGQAELRDAVILSGGTDGEDGPTDAAGAIASPRTWERSTAAKLDPRQFLARHDAYPFFAATGDLLLTGLTQTNVMDVRVILLGG